MTPGAPSAITIDVHEAALTKLYEAEEWIRTLEARVRQLAPVAEERGAKQSRPRAQVGPPSSKAPPLTRRPDKPAKTTVSPANSTDSQSPLEAPSRPAAAQLGIRAPRLVLQTREERPAHQLSEKQLLEKFGVLVYEMFEARRRRREVRKEEKADLAEELGAPPTSSATTPHNEKAVGAVAAVIPTTLISGPTNKGATGRAPSPPGMIRELSTKLEQLENRLKVEGGGKPLEPREFRKASQRRALDAAPNHSGGDINPPEMLTSRA